MRRPVSHPLLCDDTESQRKRQSFSDLCAEPPEAPPDSISEVRWLSTTWGGLSRFSGQWKKSLPVWVSRTMVVERWVHETKQWAIQEERLSVSGADGERRRWSLFSFDDSAISFWSRTQRATCRLLETGAVGRSSATSSRR